MLIRATPPITDPAITPALAPVLSLAGGGVEFPVCAGGREVFVLAEDAVGVEDGPVKVVVAEELAGKLLLDSS